MSYNFFDRSGSCQTSINNLLKEMALDFQKITF